jgi:hypothetical protein
MSQGRRKWESIDLLKLMLNWDANQWNAWLTKCDKSDNVIELQKVRYGIQAGMDSLTKQKMNTDTVIVTYLRMLKSIENTAKKIYRRRYPNPCDQPRLAKEYSEFLEDKRKRDQQLESYFKKSGF